MKQSARNTTIEWLRIVSAFLIVCIHAKYFSVGPVANLAVPMFSMIAGYFWVSGLTRDTGWSRLWMRAKRLLVPLVVWSVVYWSLNNVVFDLLVKHQSVEWPSLPDVLMLILQGGAAAHLWFLPALFVFSVMAFLLFRATDSRLIRILGLLAIVVVSVACVAFISDVTSATVLGWIKLYAARLAIFAGLGGMIALMPDVWLNGGLSKPFALIACLIGIVMMGLTNGLYAGTLIVIGVFIMALCCPNCPLPRWARSCADSSMDIYLMHVAIAVGLSTLLERVGLTSWMFGFVSVLVAFAGSWLASILMRRVLRSVKHGV